MSVRLDDISLTRDHGKVLASVTMQAQRGKMTGIIGPNGAGKSTLLKVLMGLMMPDGGTVWVDARNVTALAGVERARIFGLLPQKPDFCWPMSVHDIVTLGHVSDTPRSFLTSIPATHATDDTVMDLLHQLGISHLAQRSVTALSGGEQALVALARLLLPDHDQLTRACLLADEPLQSLDPSHQLMVLDCLRRFAQQGAAVIVVFHDLNLATQYCDRLVVLDQGRVIAEDETTAIIASGVIENVFSVDPRRFITPPQ